MSWQNGSDIGVQVLNVFRDGIRLEVVRVPLRVEDEGEYTLVPAEATAASRRRWIQADPRPAPGRRLPGTSRGGPDASRPTG